MNSSWTNLTPLTGTQQAYGYIQSKYTIINGYLNATNILLRSLIDAPAYHTVQVRQAFNLSVPQSQLATQPPAQLATAPEQSQTRRKIDWPQPVRSYVQRSFETCNLLEDVTRSEMESKLKETITAATDEDKLDKIDWNNLPLPQEMIRMGRLQVTWQQEPSEQRNANGCPNPTQNSRKRKSQELGRGEDANIFSRNPNKNLGIDESSTRGKNQGEKGTSKLQKSFEKRQRRCDGGYKTYKPCSIPEQSSGPVVGTCQVLEKRYFRLTSAPNPAQVRPEVILRQSLDLLKKKWKREGNYSYICDQFKSMRQDLTVQHITNDFTVTVYEIHARIALEKGDLGEYNQCQTQLRNLYAQNLGGNAVEFKAYRILYFIHTSNRTALNDMLADLTTAEKEEVPIKHALDVRSALALGNYHKFFRLYLDTPNMGAYLMDMFVVRERLAALSNICKAYVPDVKLRFITEELGFESDSDAAQFVCDHNGQHLIEEKLGSLLILTGKAGSFFENAKNEAFRKVDIKGQI
ncbi:Bgt-5100 [Blumeria graminis f. sp. tritici]|uniref:Bgt-5100 n=2 Tax=Blumeria graminis f. sp. tritici TaxID=62690 RepID=A0A381L659_BLUGR|nr:hypothetical protein BGT96224_5100 [Blumeria graminis f. sp. tritici 96224]VDB92705.1 Bgt-5100 [Blumeria graminis f. sp. tritici]